MNKKTLYREMIIKLKLSSIERSVDLLKDFVIGLTQVSILNKSQSSYYEF